MDRNKKQRYVLYIAFLLLAFFGATLLAASGKNGYALIFLSASAVYVAISLLLGSSPRFQENENIENILPFFPYPAAILSKNGKVVWYNPKMQQLFGGELLFHRDIASLLPDFNEKHLSETDFAANVIYGDKTYKALTAKFSSGDDKDSIYLYLIDISDYILLDTKYKNEKLVETVIMVDNLEEVRKSASDEDAPTVSSKIERALVAMASENGGILKSLEKDKYVFFLSRSAFNEMKAKKFPVTEKIKEIFKGFPMIPTLSIGAGLDGETFSENDRFASSALDMALGRGGDQIVIRNPEGFEYFGGNSKAIERRSKVRARVVAHALRELCAKSEQIVIMGHPFPDIDCIGAAVALAAYARKNKFRAHIVCGSGDKIVNSVVSSLRESGDYQNTFIKPEAAKEYVNSKTLLIVLDTHKSTFVEVPELLGMAGNVAVIDHHRRGADFIENPALLYHEPYASSTCEMVTEILQYMGQGQILSPKEAVAVYAGIYLDTKAFSVKTGVRTLESAAYLRRSGVDPIEVKNLFRCDYNTFLEKSRLMQGAKILKDNMAIVKTEDPVPQSVIAQIADELIGISEIDTSFVIAPIASRYSISARSTGKVNVQVIAEKLGGGGHMTVAGCQIEAESAEEAEKILISAIEEYADNNRKD